MRSARSIAHVSGVGSAPNIYRSGTASYNGLYTIYCKWSRSRSVLGGRWLAVSSILVVNVITYQVCISMGLICTPTGFRCHFYLWADAGLASATSMALDYRTYVYHTKV